MAFVPRPQEAEEDTNVDVHTTRGTPIRYLPLDHLYSATSPCRVTASGSSNVMSKKVKARKLNLTHFEFDLDHKNSPGKPPLLHVYARRHKRSRHSSESLSFFDSLTRRGGPTSDICKIDDSGEHLENGNSEAGTLKKKRKVGSAELVNLGVDLSALGTLDGPRLRDCRGHNVANISDCDSSMKKNGAPLENLPKLLPASRTVKRWVRLTFDNADPETLVGLRCKAIF